MLLFIDELDIHLLPKIGYEWTLKGTQTEIMTQDRTKNVLAGGLNFMTDNITHDRYS